MKTSFAVAGGLVKAVVWVVRRLSGLVLVIGAIGLGVVWLIGVVVQVLSGVLSWHGLVYSFGLAKAGDFETVRI